MTLSSLNGLGNSSVSALALGSRAGANDTSTAEVQAI
jgi:hypothetical protein